MKVSIVFSRNKKIGSRAIAWGSGLLLKGELDKVPSHAAILLEYSKSEKSIVFESTFDSGVRILPFAKWSEINELCYKIETNIHGDYIWSYVNKFWGMKYDWPGLCFFTISLIGHLLFGINIPKENSWGSDNRHFCNELIGTIIDYPKFSMVTPAKMCVDLLDKKG